MDTPDPSPAPRAVFAIRFALLALALPVLLSLFVYYGFASGYSGQGVFTPEGFARQYGQGIFRYRVLGSALQLQVYEWTRGLTLPFSPPQSDRLLEGGFSPAFYQAAFLQNAFFLCVACGLLFVLFARLLPRRLALAGDAALLLVACLLALSQYVVVPYDMLSHALFAAAALLACARHTPARFALLCGVLALATLARETAVLILPFYLAARHAAPGGLGRLTREHARLLGLAVVFALAYGGLRLALGGSGGFYQDLTLRENLTRLPNLLGMLFPAALAALLLLDRHGRRELLVYLLAALPWGFVICLVGVAWEVRLWLPLLVPMIVLKVRALGAGEATPPPG